MKKKKNNKSSYASLSVGKIPAENKPLGKVRSTKTETGGDLRTKMGR